jgi:hypothetical protein
MGMIALRFVLEIKDAPLAIIDAPNMSRAAALVRSQHLGEILQDPRLDPPLWDGHSHRTFRPATEAEERVWQKQHLRNNAEFGISEDQGLCIWLVTVPADMSPTFTCRDAWGFW